MTLMRVGRQKRSYFVMFSPPIFPSEEHLPQIHLSSVTLGLHINCLKLKAFDYLNTFQRIEKQVFPHLED